MAPKPEGALLPVEEHVFFRWEDYIQKFGQKVLKGHKRHTSADGVQGVLVPRDPRGSRAIIVTTDILEG